MTLFESGQWRRDIDRVLAELPDISALEGKTILITGAAGLICSSIVDVIFRYNDTHAVPIHVIACGRSPEKMRTRFGSLTERPDFSFCFYDASRTDNRFPVRCDHIIHGASNAFPTMIVKEPVETMVSNFWGVKCLLDLAVKQNTRRFLYISSSEVYGNAATDHPFQENEYGFVDLLDPRSSYSVGKRAAETLCVSYANEYDVDPVIVRPGHIYGPSASVHDNRVSSMWAFAAARHEDIVMKSDGSQIRSYCYCLDCAAAILAALVKGERGRAYNISNPDSVISIKQLAELLAAFGGSKIVQCSATSSEKRGFNPMTNSSLDSGSLQAIGWKGLFNAEDGLAHTVSILREIYYS